MIKKIWNLLTTPIEWCKYCNKFCYVKRRRQNTAYADEESNWITCCKHQYEEIQEYLAERWADYYGDLL